MRQDTQEKIARLFDQAKLEALALLREESHPESSLPTEPDAMDDEGITAAEAAQQLGVSTWRVYEMIKRGMLIAYRPSPRTLRVRRGAVREFIRTGRCTTVGKEGTARIQPLKLVV